MVFAKWQINSPRAKLVIDKLSYTLPALNNDFEWIGNSITTSKASTRHVVLGRSLLLRSNNGNDNAELWNIIQTFISSPIIHHRGHLDFYVQIPLLSTWIIWVSFKFRAWVNYYILNLRDASAHPYSNINGVLAKTSVNIWARMNDYIA